MKVLFRNNWIELTAFKGIVLGIAEHDGILSVMLGPLALDIKMWMFTSRPRKRGPQKF